MTEKDEGGVEAAIEEILAGEDKSQADKVRRKKRPATSDDDPLADVPGLDGATARGKGEAAAGGSDDAPGASGGHDAPGAADDHDAPDLADDGVAAEMEALRAERDQLKDRFVRALADAENARKRSDRDRREAENYGGSKLSRDMLPVYDNLRRAVESITDEQRAAASAVMEGVELTLRELTSVFARHGITVISPQEGDRFDATHHEAMFEAPVPGTKKGEIIQVTAEGFMLHDRLLRPAKVGVSSNTG